MDNQTIGIAAVVGGVLLLLLASALARVLWPEWSVPKWLDEWAARDALSRRYGDGSGGWFETVCDCCDGGDGGS